MKNFVFHNPTKIIFGRDTHHQVGTELNSFGINKVILQYSTCSIKKSGLYQQTIIALDGDRF